MRWFVWTPIDMDRDDAVVYSELVAGSGSLERSSMNVAEDYAEVWFYDGGAERQDDIPMNVVVVGDDDVELAEFAFNITIDFDPTFSVAKVINGKK